MPDRRSWFGFALALAFTATAPVQESRRVPPKSEAPAPSAEPTPDEELLEFLGSLDAEGEGWVEYLTETEVAPPVAKPPAKGAPKVKQDEHDE